MFIQCPLCGEAVPNDAIATLEVTAWCAHCARTLSLDGDIVPQVGDSEEYVARALERVRTIEPPPASVHVHDDGDRTRVEMGSWLVRTSITVTKNDVALRDLGLERWREPLPLVRGLVPLQFIEWVRVEGAVALIAFPLLIRGRAVQSAPWRLWLVDLDGHRRLALVDLTRDEASHAAAVANAAIARHKEARGYRG